MITFDADDIGARRRFLESCHWRTNGKGLWFKRGWFLSFSAAFFLERSQVETRGTVPYRATLNLGELKRLERQLAIAAAADAAEIRGAGTARARGGNR